ncbi:hypothetical protein P8605_41445 [Streptomyces sp. T-3]|nr:hypothetical protein [Streptomyces sp. T-3]
MNRREGTPMTLGESCHHAPPADGERAETRRNAAPVTGGGGA